MALATKQYQYRIGFCLYFVAFVLFLGSSVTPYFWMFERVQPDSGVHNGLSVWNVFFKICFGPKGEKWRCRTLTTTEQRKLVVAASCLFLCTLVDFAACLVLVVNNRRNKYLVWTFFPEVLAGIACQANVIGILIYVSVVYKAVNMIYGLGFSLNVSALMLAYLGLLLTGIYTNDAYDNVFFRT